MCTVVERVNTTQRCVHFEKMFCHAFSLFEHWRTCSSGFTQLVKGPRGKRMKKFSFGIVLFSVVLCALLLLCPPKGYAGTITLTLDSVGGQSSGPDYVYPYNFSFDGSANLTPLMCISYENTIYIGESWQATLVPITGSGNTQYVEAAYIFSLAADPGASAKTIAEAQWANWEFFDPNDPTLLGNLPAGYQSDINTILANAASFATNNLDTNLYPNLDIFIPLAGTQPKGDGLPQYFVGDPVSDAPEPRSYLLFGTGMLGLAFLGFRRRCVA